MSTKIENSEHKFERSLQSQSFEEYWRALRAERATPLRRMVRPQDIPPAMLPGISISAIHADGEKGPRIRFAGTRFRNLVGREVTGLQTTVLANEDDRWEMQFLIEEMSRKVFGRWSVGEVLYEHTSPLRIAVTEFPLASEADNSPDLVLSLLECSVPIGHVGRRPVQGGRVLARHFIDLGHGVPTVGAR